MSEEKTIYKVVIAGNAVSIHRVEPDAPDYAEGAALAIMRDRDAIGRFRRMKAAGEGFDGDYFFNFVDTARNFAMLRLEMLGRALDDDLDSIQRYDGRGASSHTR